MIDETVARAARRRALLEFGGGVGGGGGGGAGESGVGGLTLGGECFSVWTAVSEWRGRRGGVGGTWRVRRWRRRLRGWGRQWGAQGSRGGAKAGWVCSILMLVREGGFERGWGVDGGCG